MDSNNMYQNGQSSGTDPENNQSVNYGENGYQNNDAYNQDAYNHNPYQDQNQNYQQYQYNNYNGNYQMPYQQTPQLDLEEPVKMSEWLISMLVMMVPCVNIVMMFIWAFSKTEKKSKSNFFKVELIMMGIILVLYIVLVIIIAAAGVAGGLLR